MNQAHRDSRPVPLRLLYRVWPKRDRDDVTAYVHELYTRERRRGRPAATFWLWRQCLSLVVRLAISGRDRRRGEWNPREHRGVVSRRYVDDAVFAARSLRRSPGFTALAVTTLSLGFAAAVTVFAIVDGLIWRPLPYRDPQQLVWPWPGGGGLTHRDYDLLAGRLTPVGRLTAFADRQYALLGGETPVEIDAVAVTPNHFDVFGVSPMLGRAFSPSDAEPGASPVIVLGHSLWRLQFGGDSTVIGREVGLYRAAAIPMVQGAFSGVTPIVIGVMPPGYSPLGHEVSVWSPLPRDPASSFYSQMGELSVIARMRSGMSADDFGRAFTAVARAIEGIEHLFTTADQPVPVSTLQAALAGEVRTPMVLALAAALLVLLIACVNVANFFLARATERRRETAIRVALGAGRGRVVMSMAFEALYLTAAAAGIGWVVTLLALPAVTRMLPTHGSAAVAADGRVLLFVGLTVLISALIAGILPAMSVDLESTNSLMRGPREGRRAPSLPQGLVAVEVGIALAVAVTAVLLGESLRRVHGVDGGFVRGVLTVRVAPAAREYRDVNARRRLFAELLEEIRALPTVQAAGAIHFLPIADAGTSLFFHPTPDAERRDTHYRIVTPQYLQAMGIPLLSGRDLGPSDGEGAAPVGLVNEAFVRAFGSRSSMVGQTVYRTSGDVWFTIVGVVADVRQFDLVRAAEPEVYLPLAQSRWANAMTLVVRARDPLALAEPVRRIVRGLDADLPVTRVATMEEVVAQSVADRRFYATAFGVFAGLAVVLGAVGVYGVARFWIGGRRRELGVRLALGGSKVRIVLGELIRGTRVALLGIVGGGMVSVAAAQLLEGMLFGITPTNPFVLVAVAVLLFGVTLIATFLPVCRAARMHPMQTLRQD